MGEIGVINQTFDSLLDFFEASFLWIEDEKGKIENYGLTNLDYTHIHLTNQALTFYPNFKEKAMKWQKH